MKISVVIQSVFCPVLLAVTALPSTAMAQVVLAAAKAASEPEMYREAPGYPLLPVVALALFGLFALLGLLATLVVVSNARRDKRLEAQVDELMRANARRIESQEADRVSRRQ